MKRSKKDAPPPQAVDLSSLPEEARRAIEQLPPQFQQALSQAPPEAAEALAAFGDATETARLDAIPPDATSHTVVNQVVVNGVPVEGASIEGLDLNKLARGDLSGLGNLGSVAGAGTEAGVGAGTEGPGFSQTFTSTQISGLPQTNLEVEFEQDAYRPGDRVTGVIVARNTAKARQVNAAVAYCDASQRYQEHNVFDEAEGLHQGNLEPGTRIPFSLQLPADALPNWDPGGVAAAMARGGAAGAPSGRLDLVNYGRTYWAVVVTCTRGGMVAHDVEHHPIPLVADPSLWPGPVPDQVPDDLDEKVRGWDVEVQINQRAPRRGEEVAVDVMVGKPDSGRDGITVGLVCEIHWDYESTSNGQNGTHRSRSTNLTVVHEDWRALDGGQPIHQVRLPIPADLPFSYGRGKATKVGGFTWTSSSGSRARGDGIAFAVVWKVVAREDRRRRRDPSRTAVIIVRP